VKAILMGDEADEHRIDSTAALCFVEWAWSAHLIGNLILPLGSTNFVRAPCQVPFASYIVLLLGVLIHCFRWTTAL
jgi:hypothetical protein